MEGVSKSTLQTPAVEEAEEEEEATVEEEEEATLAEEEVIALEVEVEATAVKEAAAMPVEVKAATAAMAVKEEVTARTKVATAVVVATEPSSRTERVNIHVLSLCAFLGAQSTIVSQQISSNSNSFSSCLVVPSSVCQTKCV